MDLSFSDESIDYREDMNFVNAFKFGDFEDTFVGVFYKTINLFLEPIGFSRNVFFNRKVRKTLAIYDQQFLKEQNIFGTSRLGTYKTTQKTKGERKVGDAEDAGKVIFGNRTYEMTNHLGSVMATVSDRVKKENGAFDAVVISAQDYYPYGLMMEGRRYLNGENSYRFGFQGQEEDNETSLVNYKYRMHNPRIGRFFSVDPEAALMPAWSPYSFVFNNPIFFIDPDGRIPYPITIRSFAPFKTFGGGFHGDNRGYSTANVSARVHQKIHFDTDKTMLRTNVWSSPTYKENNPGGAETGSPSVSFTGDFTIANNGDSRTFGFGTHSKGGNPKTLGWATPNIDVFSDFSITENKKVGTLSISGKLTGDDFPSTEAFITDPSGQNLFIGVGQIDKGVGRNTGPFTELFGENKNNPITSFNFTVTTDKKGNFTGVNVGDKSYSIEAWNLSFSVKSPIEK